MNRRSLAIWALLLTFVASGLALPTAPAEAQTGTPVANRLVVPIEGTVNGVADTLTGSLAITNFAVRQGQLVAIGTLTATVLDAAGNIVQTIIRQITVPVSAITGTCQILHLELGPLDLNLLGLMIHLDQIVLDITAQSGPGNLLGNLLCAIAGLLDANDLGQQLVSLLNRLLGALSTL